MDPNIISLVADGGLAIAIIVLLLVVVWKSKDTVEAVSKAIDKYQARRYAEDQAERDLLREWGEHMAASIRPMDAAVSSLRAAMEERSRMSDERHALTLNRISSLEEERRVDKETIDRMSKQIAQLQVEIRERDKRLQDAQNRIAELELERARSIAEAATERQQLEATIAALKSELDELRTRLAAAQAARSKMTDDS